MQMAPRQIPQPKIQPEEPIYGIEQLQLFPRLTRAIYREQYNVEPPPYDPAKRIKRWFDSTHVENGLGGLAAVQVRYTVHDPGSPGGLVEISMTADEAATVNLPGAVVYPKYSPAPTTAWINGPSESVPFPVDYLSHEDAARALLLEVGGVEASLKQTLPAGPYFVVWGTEERRPWTFEAGGERYYAAALLRAKYAKGVGAPGRWDFQTAGGLAWVPEVADNGEHDLRPEIGMPLRPLAWNEELEQGLGGVWRVRRKDKLASQEAKEAMQLRTLFLVQKIAEKLGIAVEK